MDLFTSMNKSLKEISDNTGTTIDVNIVTPVNALTVLITSVDGGTP